ncbi:hypothetical protein Rleg4DRAFT_7673 [Rhizobium leguminosarum bv. trifolii WSM2297]|uniref:Uncharacterized protein n=1 Tax=Rhizobium leguminosarum bv. trifolii WSM2297 TaxID=754762 RepID=J0WJW8_RHILT|nr:hypothetical protein [Rhizobium leguminosarum]EJC85338.1 hypothetical protein Rleg4DRAFT_7218 [Rhizobium leguminosarum bv. trifolii WSM2297]EJC85778.1 hypothetical protein Rleg4DRAFT_7673 [Rhizobium leguminosarum bv. trifolii WSM2297]
MLLALISLTDFEIELVTSAVREWCRLHHRDIDSSDGRRALTVAVDLVQSKHTEECLLPELTQRLAPPSATPPQNAHVVSDRTRAS